MSTRFQAPRGTQDVLPADQPYWQVVNEAAEEIARRFGFRRIDTPLFEQAELYKKGSGDTTDVVEKEMYVFTDRGGEELALSPEGTPGIARAYLENGMGSWPQPVRLYTLHPMFRYDRPQKGRYRQHTQFDCEVIGSADPLADVEVIEILWRLFERVGITNAELRLGSIDDLEPRRAYSERLKEYYQPHLESLSADSQRRFERNPLRLLDSKDERDQEVKEAAPKLIDSLSPAAQEHHEAVQAALAAVGIPYKVDPLLVRGLDYYNRTVFEFVPKDDERAQGTMGGGGRYDGLMEILGGPATAAVGFGSGIERIILEMKKNGVNFEPDPLAEVYIVHRAEGGRPAVARLASELRQKSIATVAGDGGRSMKAQFRAADASGAKLALVLGDDELAAKEVTVRELRGDGEQSRVGLETAAAEVARRLGLRG